MCVTFKGVKYFILELFHLTFRWVANEPFLSVSRAIFLSSLNGEPLLKFHVLKWTVIKFKCFFYSFSNVFCFHNKMKGYLFFNPPKATLNTFNECNAGTTSLNIFHMPLFVYLLPRAFSLFCTCPAYNKSEKAFARSLFLFSCSLNPITFCVPHLEVLELMTLPKTPVLIAKYHLLSNSFLSTLTWVTAVFLQTKQRALERALKKHIFTGAAWSENSVDLIIYALIWISAISGKCLLNILTA